MSDEDPAVPRTEAADKLRDLLTNRQMPDNATLTVTLGELRRAFGAAAAPQIDVEQEAATLLDAIDELRHYRGRLSKVTVADLAAVLTAMRRLSPPPVAGEAAAPGAALDAAWQRAEAACKAAGLRFGGVIQRGRVTEMWQGVAFDPEAREIQSGMAAIEGPQCPTPAAALDALAQRLGATPDPLAAER